MQGPKKQRELKIDDVNETLIECHMESKEALGQNIAPRELAKAQELHVFKTNKYFVCVGPMGRQVFKAAIKEGGSVKYPLRGNGRKLAKGQCPSLMLIDHNKGIKLLEE